MNLERLHELHSRYPHLTIGVLGDFCLDRYLEIDPSRSETSIETGLPVHQVTRVRPQAGAAGTVLNNLAALGIGSLFPIGFCGQDGEGFELAAQLRSLPGVDTRFLLETPLRRTFTYTKPLLIQPPHPPRELNRLDLKNWSPTPESVSRCLSDFLECIFPELDVLIVMDQVDLPQTGVVTTPVLQALGRMRTLHPGVPVFADSRSGLGRFPACRFKLNASELAALAGESISTRSACAAAAKLLAEKTLEPVYVTLSAEGILYAEPGPEPPLFVRALPVRGPIDVVGAGDCVTANLAAATAAGAGVAESLQMAMLAGSHVVHQLGTSGAASCADQRRLLSLTPEAVPEELRGS